MPRDDSGFADVLNAVTIGRPRRRPPVEDVGPARPAAPARRVEEPAPVAPAAIARPYAWTAGRTRCAARLELETLVSAAGGATAEPLPAEHCAVVELCAAVRSVAEVAALLALPLGVAKVLVGDLAGRGVLVVHGSAGGVRAEPDVAVLERVLSGLRGM